MLSTAPCLGPPSPSSAAATTRRSPLSRLALPYVPLLLAAVAGLTVQVFRGSFEPFLVLVGTAVGLLVVGRQVVALVENRLLTARLQATVTDLAQRERPLIEALLRELAVADGLRRHLQADEDSP